VLTAATACTAGSAGGRLGIASGTNIVPVAIPDREPGPSFSGPSLRPGSPIGEAVYAGKVALVNFWGSWCGPCRREQPVLERLWKEYGPRGVQFLGVAERDQKAAALAFLEEFGVTYPSVYDPDSSVAFRFKVRVMPNTFVIDRRGRIAARIVGAADDEVVLRRILDAELGA
jgi:DsbE subfamily thiol:disulfide oxidoreductase